MALIHTGPPAPFTSENSRRSEFPLNRVGINFKRRLSFSRTNVTTHKGPLRRLLLCTASVDKRDDAQISTESKETLQDSNGARDSLDISTSLPIEDKLSVLQPDTLVGDDLPPWQQRWNVLWGGKELTLGLVGWVLSFFGSAIVVQVLALNAGWTPWRSSGSDDQALFILATQAARTLAGVLVIGAVIKPYNPKENGFFNFSVKNPLDVENGWLLWSFIGFFSACLLVNVEAMAEVALKGGEPPRDSADALIQLLPIIGLSPLSTLSLVAVAGICAPVLEETVFRGFLMTTLTKWMPVPWAALFSAFAFAAAHITPNEFFKLSTLGFILGLSYAKTRNMWTPMLIHGFWNSGVIILLTALKLNGFDIQELIE